MMNSHGYIIIDQQRYYSCFILECDFLFQRNKGTKEQRNKGTKACHLQMNELIDN